VKKRGYSRQFERIVYPTDLNFLYHVLLKYTHVGVVNPVINDLV